MSSRRWLWRSLSHGGLPSRGPDLTALDPSHGSALRRRPACQEGSQLQGGLDPAMLTNQSVFDWVDLRSYDIREHQGKMVHLSPGGGTSVHSEQPHPPCQGNGYGCTCYPAGVCASAAPDVGREISHQSLRSACCHEHSWDVGRFPSGAAHAVLTRRARLSTQRHACTAGGSLAGSWRQLASEKASCPQIPGWLVPPPGAVIDECPELGASSQGLSGALSARVRSGQTPPRTSLSPRPREQVFLL